MSVDGIASSAQHVMHGRTSSTPNARRRRCGSSSGSVPESGRGCPHVAFIDLIPGHRRLKAIGEICTPSPARHPRFGEPASRARSAASRTLARLKFPNCPPRRPTQLGDCCLTAYGIATWRIDRQDFPAAHFGNTDMASRTHHDGARWLAPRPATGEAEDLGADNAWHHRAPAPLPSTPSYKGNPAEVAGKILAAPALCSGCSDGNLSGNGVHVTARPIHGGRTRCSTAMPPRSNAFEHACGQTTGVSLSWLPWGGC